MPRFEFRAAAVLDLRRREEDKASRAHAETLRAVERAEEHVTRCERALADAGRESGVHDATHREWYRNWMVRQRQAVVRARAMLVDRKAAYAAATLRLNAAHRDVRVLERLRDRLFAAWQLAARRAEQKELDWLGTVRHTMAARQQEEKR